MADVSSKTISRLLDAVICGDAEQQYVFHMMHIAFASAAKNEKSGIFLR